MRRVQKARNYARKLLFGHRRSVFRRLANRLSFTINQIRIAKLASYGMPTLLRPVPPGDCSGNVEHYYHFIFDLLLPLHCLLKKIPPEAVLLIQNFGLFSSRITQLYPERVKVLDESYRDGDAREIELMGMNPQCVFLERNMLEDFKSDICSTIGVPLDGEANKILLIERLPPDDYFLSRANRIGSGASRRSIVNHSELLAALAMAVRAPFELHNVQLEKMSFDEQISYFDQSLLVIGQHGAGLANCIWMRPGTSLVEISDNQKVHFRIVSKLRQLHYFRYRVESSQAEIDITGFMRWISQNYLFKKYFKQCRPDIRGSLSSRRDQEWQNS